MILLETKKIVNVFIQAIPALRTKAFDAQSPAVVDGYEHILKEISSHLERARLHKHRRGKKAVRASQAA